jgi:hypothetical protein
MKIKYICMLYNMTKSKKNIKKNRRNSLKKFKLSGGKILNVHRNSISEILNNVDPVSVVTLDVKPTDTIFSIKLKVMNIFGLKEEDTPNIYILQFNDNELLDKNTIADYDDILDNSNLILINRPAQLSDISSIMENYFSLRDTVKTQIQEQQSLKERIKKYQEEIEATMKKITELKANIEQENDLDKKQKKMTLEQQVALYHANTDNQYD